jgi:hypothetical protein
MNPRRLAGAFVLAALVALPGLAVAQGYQQGPPPPPPHSYAGIIQSVQGSSFTLNTGRTVFMHQGTVIRPTGIRLRPGMHVTVYGPRAGNGAINANEVDVIRHYYR